MGKAKLTNQERKLLKRVFANAKEAANVCGDELDGVIPENADGVKCLRSLERKLNKLI